MPRRRPAGFTLIEIAVLIVVISVVGLIALSRFFDFSRQAQDRAETGVIASVRDSLRYYGAESKAKARTPTYPPTLDAASAGPSSSSNPFFTAVLIHGTQDGTWTKSSATRYRSPGGTSYVYDPNEGTFLESATPLTPLGSTFGEITGNLINLIQLYYDTQGSWPRSWGDYRYTDLGLDPAVWNGVPYEGLIYGTGGSRISIKPGAGWRITATGLDGNVRVLTAKLNWNLWYDMTTSAWYYHTITPEEMIDIGTMQVTPP